MIYSIQNKSQLFIQLAVKIITYDQGNEQKWLMGSIAKGGTIKFLGRIEAGGVKGALQETGTATLRCCS